jgi:hypothetical protein
MKLVINNGFAKKLISVAIIAASLAGGYCAKVAMADELPSQSVTDKVGMPLLDQSLPAIEASHGLFYWGGVKRDKDHIVYVFADPNCIYCEKIYQLIQRNENKMAKLGVQVAIVPVAFLKPSSAGRAAAIIKEGWRGYLTNEVGFKQATEDGGIEPLPSVPAYKKEFEQLAVNWDALRNLAIGLKLSGVGTPFLVWKDRTNHVSYISGYNESAFNKMIESATHDPKVKWDGTL